jgi:hypothetical protein
MRLGWSKEPQWENGWGPFLTMFSTSAGPKSQVPSHLRSIHAILIVEGMEVGTYHMGFQPHGIPCPKYDMDAYMAILFGGETCDESWVAQKPRPNSQRKSHDYLHKMIKIRLLWSLIMFYWFLEAQFKSWDFASMLGLGITCEHVLSCPQSAPHIGTWLSGCLIASGLT